MQIKCSHPVFIIRQDLCRKHSEGYTKFRIPMLNSGKIMPLTGFTWNNLFYCYPVIAYHLMEEYYYTGLPKIKMAFMEDDDKSFYYPEYRYTEKEFLSCELINEFTGDTIPLLQEVPCGHCQLCNDARVRAYQNRIMLHSQWSESIPLFVTLTYETLPKKDKDLQFITRELQLFNKRFRKLLTKGDSSLGISPTEQKYKYFLVSEYGSKNGRLHYHGVFFDIPRKYYDQKVQNIWQDKDKLRTIPAITHLIRRAWNKGFVYVEETKDNAAAYCMKYMKKGSKFKTKSLHSINIGKDKLLDLSRYYREHPEEQKIYLTLQKSVFNKETCKREVVAVPYEVPIDKYIQRIFYPSVVDSLDYKFRSILHLACNIYRRIRSNTDVLISVQTRKLIDIFELKYLPLCVACDFETKNYEDKEVYNLDLCLSELLLLVNELDNMIESFGYDLDSILIFDDMYKRHVACQTNITDYDIGAILERSQINHKKIELLECDNQ